MGINSGFKGLTYYLFTLLCIYSICPVTHIYIIKPFTLLFVPFSCLIYIYFYPSISSHPHKDSLHSTDCLLCELRDLCNQTTGLFYRLTGLGRFITYVPKKDRSSTDAVSLLVQTARLSLHTADYCRHEALYG